MFIKCLHEIYIEPKMFQTIGFHHQGLYNICIQAYTKSIATNNKIYAFPILCNYRHSYAPNYGDQQNRVNENKMEYHTNKFEVSFNEQEFIFNGGCRFKIQIQEQQIQEGVGDKENAESEHKNVYVVMKLIKYNAVQEEKSKQKQAGKKHQVNNGMHSTENIIKQIQQLDQAPKAPISNKKPNKKQEKKKTIQQVCQVTITVDTCTNCIANTRSIYQTVGFPVQQYFGKLFYMINHVKIGYKIRSNDSSIEQFYKNINPEVLETKPLDNSLNKKSVGNNLNNQQSNKPRKLSSKELFQFLSQKYTNVVNFYKQFVRQQILQLNRIIETENDFIKLMQRSSNIQKVQTQKNITPMKIKSNTHIQSSKNIQPLILKRSFPSMQVAPKGELHGLSISIPQQHIYYSWKTLCQYYECESIEQLYPIIYGQNVNLTHYIIYKWLEVVNHMNKQRWCASYFHKTIINFKQQIEYIKEKRIYHHLNEVKEFVQFQPRLKYKSFVHADLPFFYMKRTLTHNKDLINTSPQHILFVLVHGFNGNQHDMNRIKSFIGYFSSPHFLVLKRITTKIQETLDVIGKTAAQEITQYLKARPFIKRINFIGFSLGGVIIRACIPYLKEYHMLFNMLITLSSPHLGVKEINSCIVKTGMHLLHHLKGIKNLKELLLDYKEQEINKSQRTNEQNKLNNMSNDAGVQIYSEHLTYLEKLSKDPSIGVFNLVVVCGAEQDKYVPGFSAALDYHGDNERINNMMSNLKGNIRNLHQIYVKFDPKKKGTMWDRVSGRRVHINFLDDDSFLHFFLAQYFHIF